MAAIFTDQDKLDAIEVEIVRRKRIHKSVPTNWNYDAIQIMKSIAVDYRAKLGQERTDEDRTQQVDAGYGDTGAR